MVNISKKKTSTAWLTLSLLVGGVSASPPPPTEAAKLATCDTTDPNQGWSLREANTWDVTATLINYKTKCLDVAMRDKGPNAAVRSWNCCCEHMNCCGGCGVNNENANQMYALKNGTFVTTGSEMGGLCLVAASGVSIGSPIQTQLCSDAAIVGTRIVYSATAPHLRVESNTSLCVATSASPPSPPPSPVPVPQACSAGTNTTSLPFCDVTLPIPQRIKDLVSRMTIAEKVTQLQGGIRGGITPAVSRLGVPPYQYHSEGLHGLRDTCHIGPGGSNLYSTMFPQVTGMAATGNLSLVHAMAAHMSDEARAVNNFMQGRTLSKGTGLNYWGPTMNIGRDPRWGRFQESVSEDPWLNGAYSVNYVKGFQGADDGVKYIKAASCCKHFYAYSLEDADGFTRHNFNAKISAQDLAETYNPPFAMCVAAQPEQIMCSYNAVNGVPTCFDGKAQNGFLRDELSFDGVIFSDCDAVGDGYSAHHYAKSEADACALGINNGCDVDCGATYSPKNLQAAISQNLLNESMLDVAVGRAFTMRMRAGMFDPPSMNVYTKITTDVMNNAYGQALALDAARQSIILLQNRAHMLPLNKSSAKKIAVIGPMANETAIMMGGKSDYCPEFVVSACEGIKARAKSENIEVVCDDGSNAATAAQGADIVIGVMGGVLGGEARDRINISLPADQLILTDTLMKIAGHKLILTLINGEPVALDNLKDNIDTIVIALEGGQSGGTALANIMFGDVSPSGVLPFTVYPTNYVDLVMMSNMEMRPSSTSPGHTYRFLNIAPQFPFGFGLSYTTWTMSWVKSSLPSAMVPAATLESGLSVSVTVTNTGAMDSAKVVQLYVAKQKGDGLTRTLVAMEKVFVQAQGTVTVKLNTSAYKGFCAFCVVDESGTSSIPAHTSYSVSVGNGVDDHFPGFVVMTPE